MPGSDVKFYFNPNRKLDGPTREAHVGVQDNPSMAFLSDLQQLGRLLESFRSASQSRQAPVIRQKPMAEIIHELRLDVLVREGGLQGEVLAQFLNLYLDSTTRLEHPGYMAHQVAVTHPTGALGALVDAFTNNPMAIYEMGPAAAAIEYFMINWMLSYVGFQPAPLNPSAHPQSVWGGGVFVNGGSLANLTALIAARTRLAPHVWESGNPSDLALMAPSECHYSITRAAGIMGMGRKAIYLLDVDEKGTVIPDRLNSVYERLYNDGKQAVALVANACNTPVGTYDPLREIGEFCRARNIWFHVDGAHGASALLSERYRCLLDGIELADSVIWDAHKLMRTPPLCAAVLVANHNDLDRAFEQEASYLFHDKNQPGVDFIHRTVECTKSGLGLKLFFVAAALGEKGLAAYVERQCDLAAEAYAYLLKQPDIECPVSPQSNILCFRVRGSDQDQLAHRDRLIASGEFHLSTTLFKGRRYLRIVFMSPQTTLQDVKALVAALRRPL
jgi:L-2,4-diaminobutyrate decarboxylase